MAVMHSPESKYAQERRKWEAQNSELGPAGRPFVFRQYPMMVHKAGRPESGLGAHTLVEQRIAADEKDVDLWWSEGFRPTPLEAIAHFEAQRVEFAKLAAERNWEVEHGRVSQKAAAEIADAEAQHEGYGHMPMVPETPIAPKKKEK